MKLSLYIAGRLADLSAGGTEALILWTYTREDTEAPAAVKNSYTKTITIPATAANDTIFSHIYRPDHDTHSVGGFDPLARTPFVIQSEAGEVLERGYLKLDRVLRRGAAPQYYEVTLYGGLGDFFYNLMYKADGTKRTLGDMRWLTTMLGGVNNLEEARLLIYTTDWSYLYNDTYDTRPDCCMTDVPVQGGIPDGNFDAGKAYYKPGSNEYYQFSNIVTRKVVGGVTYGPHPNAGGGVILDLGNKVTGWEAQCLDRETTLRPAIHFARFLRSIEVGSWAGDFGDWEFYISGGWDVRENPDYWLLWMLVPHPNAINQGLDQALSGTLSPAEYLLGYAKMFGLVFVVDSARKVIRLMPREKYYNPDNLAGNEAIAAAAIDLSERVGDDVDFRPYLMNARIYDFSVPVSGAFAEQYATRWGRKYGDFLLDTGFSFGDVINEAMKSLPFNGVADVQEQSAWYLVCVGEPGQSGTAGNSCKFPLYGDVTYLLYNSNGQASIKMTAEYPVMERRKYALPALPQFHDADGKPTTSDNVLLYFLGEYSLPAGSQRWNPIFWRTGSRNMGDLTGGKSVYDITPPEGSAGITSIPLFRRWYDPQPGPDAQWERGLDFGDPKQHATGDSNIPSSEVYARRWKYYLADRFDRDAVVMTASVNFSGIHVGPELLRRFFYYRGARWSLNKIIDYNPARPGNLVKCEFVRVQDLYAYTGLQDE